MQQQKQYKRPNSCLLEQEKHSLLDFAKFGYVSHFIGEGKEKSGEEGRPRRGNKAVVVVAALQLVKVFLSRLCLSVCLSVWLAQLANTKLTNLAAAYMHACVAVACCCCW